MNIRLINERLITYLAVLIASLFFLALAWSTQGFVHILAICAIIALLTVLGYEIAGDVSAAHRAWIRRATYRNKIR